MASRDSLGPCPQCGADIGSANVLIRYEFDGEPAAWAECPRCQVVVDPIRGAGSTLRDDARNASRSVTSDS